MNFQRKQLLRLNQHRIVEDLDPTWILDELLQSEAIRSKEYDRIVNVGDRQEKSRALLEILAKTGTNKSYDTFTRVLKKDHPWLSEGLMLENAKVSDLDESFDDALSRGDVPRLPLFYVSRKQPEQEVAQRLTALKRHQTLALHGMTGSGKTDLAVAVLRTARDLLETCGHVFWLSMKNCLTEDDVMAQQIKLHRKVTSLFNMAAMTDSGTYITSSSTSLGSNWNMSTSSVEYNMDEYRRMLMTAFEDPSLKQCLIVLDEVKKDFCLKAFDIGCKLLVTTQDLSLLAKDSSVHTYAMPQGFTAQESLELFSKCLETPTHELPRHAKLIHEACKGFPIQIALVGAVLADDKDRLRLDKKRWRHYLDRLNRSGGLYSLLSLANPSNTEDQTTKAIKMCIDELPYEIKALFKKLAVLPEDVKVSPNVLAVLWQKSVMDVDIIVKSLKKKSMMNESFDKDLSDYTYELNDWILRTLRSFHTENELQKLHVEFLNNYGFYVDEYKVDLKDDKYIAFYIGYHIFKTGNLNGMWKLFEKLYMDLTFLGNKVKLTGLADLFVDFQRYEDKICQNEVDRELLGAVKAYLGSHGNDLHRYPGTDIAQSVLQHAASGPLYQRAYGVAQQGADAGHLYFEFTHETKDSHESHSPTTIDVQEMVRAVGFVGNHVLVGTDTGKLMVFYVYTNALRYEVAACGGAVRWVGVCPARAPQAVVACLAADGSVALVCVKGLHDVDGDGDGDHVKDKDKSGNVDDAIAEESEELPVCVCDSRITIPAPKLPHLNCVWANNAELLYAHTARQLLVYDINGKLKETFDVWEPDRSFICCALSYEDKLLFIGSVMNETYSVDIVNARTHDRMCTFNQLSPLIQIFTVPNSTSVLVLNSTEVLEHSWQLQSPYNPLTTKYKANEPRTVLRAEGMLFLSGVVNKSGTLLFVSTNESRIMCVCLNSYQHIFSLDNRRGNVVCMDVSETWVDMFEADSDILLSGTGDVEHSVKIWRLDNAYVTMQSKTDRLSKLTSKFDASFLTGYSTPVTPSHAAPCSSLQTTPRRHQSLKAGDDKKPIKKTISLDRHSLKPLNLKGISNGCEEIGLKPLLAVVDDHNCIQILRGRRRLTEVKEKLDDRITIVLISPCNHYVFYGLTKGSVKQYTIRSKETKTIMELQSPVQYMAFVTGELMIASGKNRRVMAYRLQDGGWQPLMLQSGNTGFGSQDMLDKWFSERIVLNHHPETLSNGSATSNRTFPCSDTRLSTSSALVRCWWTLGGLLTVEDTGCVKAWDAALALRAVLQGRLDARVSCAALQPPLLALCGDHGRFWIYKMAEVDDRISLTQTTEYQAEASDITACDLSADGRLLAMGFESGNIIVWNVKAKRQLRYLHHHKNAVQVCLFSPSPDCPSRPPNSPSVAPGSSPSATPPLDDGAPLVLVTMATEIVWWNVTRMLTKTSSRHRPSWNIMTPPAITSPTSPIAILSPNNRHNDSNSNNTNNNGNNNGLSNSKGEQHFFGDSVPYSDVSWETLWKGKRCKPGSRNEDMLACVKLLGVSAARLLCDARFGCFVTVDNQGCVHIMNLIPPSVRA